MSRDLAHLGVYLFFFFSLVCIGFPFFLLCAMRTEREKERCDLHTLTYPFNRAFN